MENIASTLIVFALLLLASAFFSASETALTGASKVRLKSQEEQGDRAAARALRLVDEYDKTLSTLLIGNNVVNTLLASLATVFCSQLFAASGVGIATAAVTVLVLIFGEVTPKTYAGGHAESIIKRFSPIVLALKLLLSPASAALRALQRLMLPASQDSDPTVTEDELRVLFDQGVDEGVLEEDRSELLQKALEFDDITAEDVLTPRVNLAAVELHTPPQEVQQVFLQQHFTRLPVYIKDLDHIVGVVSQKDFFAALVTGAPTELSGLLQPCLYVPPKKHVAELMSELQHRRMHIAVVTDEYGGTSGIVTLEDIVEELVGEIWDEHEKVNVPLRHLWGDSWEMDGELEVQDLYEALCKDEPVPETDASTVAGLALEHLGHIPDPGESFVLGPLHFTVTQVSEQRIRQLQVSMHTEPPPEPPHNELRETLHARREELRDTLRERREEERAAREAAQPARETRRPGEARPGRGEEARRAARTADPANGGRG